MTKREVLIELLEQALDFIDKVSLRELASSQCKT